MCLLHPAQADTADLLGRRNIKRAEGIVDVVGRLAEELRLLDPLEILLLGFWFCMEI